MSEITPLPATGWKSFSTTKKVLVIGVPTVLTLGLFALWYFNKDKKDTANTVPPDKKPIPPDNSGLGQASEQHEASAAEVNTDVPEGATSCGPIIDSYDSEFNYIKCANDWYARSKPDARNAKNRTLYPTWYNLKDKPVALDRLNMRYPNGTPK